MDNKKFWEEFSKSIKVMVGLMNRTMRTNVTAEFDDEKMLLTTKGEYFEATYNYGFMSSTNFVDVSDGGIAIKLLPAAKPLVGKELANTPMFSEMTLIFSLNQNYQVAMQDFLTEGFSVGGTPYELGQGGMSLLIDSEGES